MKRIVVMTSGGDAPGMNAAIRAVTRYGIEPGSAARRPGVAVDASDVGSGIARLAASDPGQASSGKRLIVEG